MDGVTELYRSQIGGTSVINYSYTDLPWRLLARDVYYFFCYAWALPWIVWPAFTYGSGELDELFPTWRNLFCVGMHTLLVILQLGFIVALPFSVILPVWAVAVLVGGFLFFNWLLCKLLNGNQVILHSDEGYARALPEHSHEQWVFVNGVAAGQHWLKGNLNRLAFTFKRPVLGIHNPTAGIIFDVVECLVQRNLSYATLDVRVTYKLLKEILYNPAKTKVVLILHSQGGIEGGLVLDWLLQEVPQDLLAKLEVYTFGCAANHFNNPHRHAFAQKLMRDKPTIAINTVMTEASAAMPAPSPHEARDDLTLKIPPRDTSSHSSTRTARAAHDRAIGHIEHYAHSTDFVAVWGVLHFATNRLGSPQIPRYLGRLFVRSSGHGGHQFNQHYLDGMFPLKRDPATGEFIGAEEENNEFMNEVIKIGTEGESMENIREAFDITYSGTCFGTGEVTTPAEVYGIADRKFGRKGKKDVKMKDLSRLWSYRNGKSPLDVPTPVVSDGAGIARNGRNGNM